MPKPFPSVRLAAGDFVVRDLEPSDRDAIVALADDERLFAHMMIRFTRSEMDGWFTAWQTEVASTERSYWPLIIEVGGAVSGFTMLSRSSPQVAELQWYVAPRNWGRGAATAATSLVLPYLFDVLSMHRVFATADPENEASIRTLQRAGFREEGRMRDYILAHNGWCDRVMLALLDEEWRQARSRPI